MCVCVCVCVRRSEAGPTVQRPGTFATEAKEVDNVARRAWNKVYEGDGNDQRCRAITLVAKYGEWMHKERQEDSEPINEQQVEEACQGGTASAAGPDGMEPF